MPAFPQVGDYQINAEIGRGGMGVVYRAHDPHLDRPVAIKALPAEVADDETRRTRFLREARVLAGLSHPNIAMVYGLEQEQTGRFIVMELVEGETLAARLSRGRLPIDEALVVGAQIAAALEAAHERGVIHRDLKPGNVMLQPDGTAKVLDFGLAREAAPTSSMSRRVEAPTVHAAVTRDGEAVGTPGYMSPEQARGREVDRRTDIFAFGCVLFECLSGQPAFQGESGADAVAATLERDPDWSQLPERTPPRVRDLLEESLAKDPRRRLRDIGDARMVLERALDRREWTTSGSMRAARTPRRSWKRALPWTITGAVLAAAVALSVWQPWGASVPPGSPAAPAAARLPVRFTVNEAEVRHRRTFDLASLAVSRDGSMVAYTGTGPRGTCLYVRRLSEPSSTPLIFKNTADAHNLAFSPDGRWIAFAQGKEVLKIPIEGGRPVLLFQGDALTKGHCWTKRGIILSPGLSDGLALLGPDGGTLTPLTMPEATRGEVSHRWPDALPDGRHVLFTVKKSGMTTFDDADIALLDLETGTWRTIIEGGMFARYAPTGHIVYARADALLAVPFDADSLRLRGAPIAMVQGVVTEPGSGAAQFALAPESGTLVYVPGAANQPRSELVWIDFDGTRTPVGAPERNYSDPAISPDGTRIALGVYGATDSIFVFDTARGTSTRVTFEGNAHGPFWSRDGQRIGFISDRDGRRAVYCANADGSGKVERLADDALGDGRSFIEFEGAEAVLFSRDNALWVKPRDGPAQSLVTSLYPIGHAAISPDHRWLAYTGLESGQHEVYVQPFPAGEGKWQVSIGGGMMPFWLPGSDSVAYHGLDQAIHIARSGPDGYANVRPEVLCPHPPNVSHLALLPDVSRFLAIRSVPSPPDSGRVEAVLNWFEELKARARMSGE